MNISALSSTNDAHPSTSAGVTKRTSVSTRWNPADGASSTAYLTAEDVATLDQLC